LAFLMILITMMMATASLAKLPNPIHRLFDGLDQAIYVVWENVANCSDTERFHARYLARIDHESSLFQLLIKSTELEIGRLGNVKASDDGTLQLPGN
jgi:hypothetical protein